MPICEDPIVVIVFLNPAMAGCEDVNFAISGF